jgi:hypothetical protein
MQGTSLLNIKSKCSRLGSTLSVSPLTFKLIHFTFMETSVSLFTFFDFMKSCDSITTSTFDMRFIFLVFGDYTEEVLFDPSNLIFQFMCFIFYFNFLLGSLLGIESPSNIQGFFSTELSVENCQHNFTLLRLKSLIIKRRTQAQNSSGTFSIANSCHRSFNMDRS